MAKTKKVMVNGVVIGEVPVTGNAAKDLERAKRFVEEYEFQAELTLVQSMFRQASSFCFAAAEMLKQINQPPRNPMAIVPFVVNLTFSMEIYLKTLAQIHGAELAREHDLSRLLRKLPQPALDVIGATVKAIGPCRPATTIDEVLRRLAKSFERWRYIYEDGAATELPIREAIWAAEVLHRSCMESGQIN